MLLKCCIFILILSYKIILCDSDVKHGPKENTVSTTENNSIKYSKNSKELRKKLSIDLKYFPSFNRPVRLTDQDHFIGRTLEEHDVVTRDGYVLTIFRIIYEDNNPPPNKYPVLLVPGMYQSSDQYLQQLKDQSLGLKLQDLGYDVWLANFRGNKYCRKHVDLDPDTDNNKTKFFDYSYEELGVHDIASTVDFVLNKTKFHKLVYIAHSLGGTVFLVLNSLRSEYNKKFAVAYLMAPFGYQNYFPNEDLKDRVNHIDEFYNALLNQGTVEIFPYTNKSQKLSAEDCLGEEQYKKICVELNIQNFMSLKYMNNDVVETRGGSIKQLVHLAQNIRSKSFSRWDFGKNLNKEHYGKHKSPEYNVGLITAPINIIYSLGDEYVSPEDIDDMVADMVNVKITEVRRTNFTHEDFLHASDVMESVYDDIIKEIKKNPNPTFVKNKAEEESPFKNLPTWLIILALIVCGCVVICIIYNLFNCCQCSQPKKKRRCRKIISIEV